MRNILRKLHIVTGPPEDADASSPSPSSAGGRSPSNHPEQKPSPALSRWFNSAHASAASSSSSAADGERTGGMDSESSKPRRMDTAEEYQIQLALEMSMREDPEAAQIEAVKQISLGSSTPEKTPAEVLAYRYWKYNALGYDDKILDGFYDLYGSLGESSAVKMPSLVDMQGKPLSDGIYWEGILVNRAEDADLLELEQRALVMALELKSESLEFATIDLVRSLAVLVSNHMGGAISDPVNILTSWIHLSDYLRASIGNRVLPLGRLTIGLARHRALLFKVLADSLGIPCRLVKGQQYTGSDDGALNIVKLKDGREYIVDLMVDPGTLIPSDGARLARDFEKNSSVNSGVASSSSCYSENEPLDQRCMSGTLGTNCRVTVDELKKESQEGSLLEKSCAQGFITAEANILTKSSNTTSTEIAKSQEPSGRPNHPYRIARSPSWTEGISSPAVMMKVKDISRYMINATKKNPELAQKLHDVLLESGVEAPPNLFSESCMEPSEAVTAENMNVFEDTDEMIKRRNGFIHKNLDDGSHELYLPHLPMHDVPQKVVPSRSQLDPLKPVEGLGFHRPLDIQEAAAVPCPSHSEASSEQLPDTQLQLIKHMPFAAAAATAAVVASTMVVVAAKSKADMNLEVPVAAAAATATAAAVVATTAAVSRQYEHLESCSPAPPAVIGGCDNTKLNEKKGDVLDNPRPGNDHRNDGGLVLELDTGEIHQKERHSDRSTENESAKPDISLDDVAELEIPWEDIILGERIGLGSFGEVYHGDWHGTEVAVKKFLLQDISSDALAEFISEVRIMKRLRHPNVVLLMGAVTHVPNLSIVTEFLHRGSLFRLIHRPNNQLDERRRLRMALDVARGMNYLHNCMPVIVHRDLKSPNLLVDRNWVVKVCDFGLSRMKHNTFLSSRSTAGTAEWMAPEVLRNEPSDEKCDVFSFGVILWELCTLQQPWGGMNPMQVVGAVGFQHRRLDIPDDLDPAIADIVKKCWNTDPKMRPSFSEIMAALKPLQKSLSGTQVARQRALAADKRGKGPS